jgi:hypothetical protein
MIKNTWASVKPKVIEALDSGTPIPVPHHVVRMLLTDTLAKQQKILEQRNWSIADWKDYKHYQRRKENMEALLDTDADTFILIGFKRDRTKHQEDSKEPEIEFFANSMSRIYLRQDDNQSSEPLASKKPHQTKNDLDEIQEYEASEAEERAEEEMDKEIAMLERSYKGEKQQGTKK